MNPRKNRIPKTIWFKSENEFIKLKELCNLEFFTEEAGRLIKEVLVRKENES